MRLRFGLVVASAMLVAFPSPAHATGKAPSLERFIARYNPQSTTTFYIAVANDPDGGKVTYQWSLKTSCGFLTEPDSTGPSNGFQFGSPARQPSGCTLQEQSAARLTVRIVDADGCAIDYTQLARDETEHINPKTDAEPCPPVAGAKTAGTAATPPSGGFPIAAVIVVLVIAGGVVLLAMRRLRPAPAPAPRRAAGAWVEVFDAAAIPAQIPAPALEQPQPPYSYAQARSEPEPQIQPQPRYEPRIVDDESTWLLAGIEEDGGIPTRRDVGLRVIEDDAPTIVDASAGFVDPDVLSLEETLGAFADEAPLLAEITQTERPECVDGAVRGEGNDFVAHDTVLAGAVYASTPDGERVEIPPDDLMAIMRLAERLGDRPALEVQVEVPLRLVTVVCTRREICRGGRWVLDVQSTTHDGPERVERLRAIVTSPEELERFSDQIVMKRLRTLTDSRRRLESTLAQMRGAAAR